MWIPFWEAKWKWAVGASEVGELRNGSAPFSIRVPGLAAEISGTIHVESPNVVTYEGVVRHSATRPDVIGGGMQFELNFQSQFFGGRTPATPELLPNNEGFVWHLNSGGSANSTEPMRAIKRSKSCFHPACARSSSRTATKTGSEPS